ncbi:MAG: SGNH/GDSL hydrolase family protein [Planctomycetia bacterium]|nr:SGNH/GDSL hydrolase family protein [Planctomycetia bacterium]
MSKHPLSRRSFVRFALLAAVFVLGASMARGETAPAVKPKIEGGAAFYNVQDWGVEGRGWNDTKRYFDRLPGKAEGVVREPVWGLSRDSAGMVARFETDATEISVRYTLRSDRLAMPHMPATGVSGVDLYAKHKERWRWLTVAQPTSKSTTLTTGGLDPGRREYLLYLPLYNGVESLEIGVPKDAAFVPEPPRKDKPIVFYGTSICQGGCASRPGMLYTSILGRRLDRPVINLGFSGNGTMDASMGELMGELDAAVYVIDCLPNMSADVVAQRTEPLVRQLRKARPDAAIVLVEDRTYDFAFLHKDARDRHATSRAALKAAYDKLVADGVKGLSYVPGDTLLGADGESTVDGSHPNDLGMMRMADALAPVLKPLVGKP